MLGKRGHSKTIITSPPKEYVSYSLVSAVGDMSRSSAIEMAFRICLHDWSMAAPCPTRNTLLERDRMCCRVLPLGVVASRFIAWEDCLHLFTPLQKKSALRSIFSIIDQNRYFCAMGYKAVPKYKLVYIRV